MSHLLCRQKRRVGGRGSSVSIDPVGGVDCLGKKCRYYYQTGLSGRLLSPFTSSAASAVAAASCISVLREVALPRSVRYHWRVVYGTTSTGQQLTRGEAFRGILSRGTMALSSPLYASRMYDYDVD
jgi:hypothetical protein